jgi:soluble lytic murein transglycosylase
MSPRLRKLMPVIFALGLVPGAWALEIGGALRADRWAEAAGLAATYADPVAERLVTYYRLLAPGAAGVGEIAQFMRDNPGWPNQATLERRREEALLAEPYSGDVLEQCGQGSIELAATLLRCADIYASAGQADEAASAARRAWIGPGIIDPADEADFMRRWGSGITASDQWARFQALAWNSNNNNNSLGAAAARQVLRLTEGEKPVAASRLALRRDGAGAAALLARVPASAQNDPGFMLDEARWLRRAGRDRDAAALWQTHGAAAERAAPAEHLGEFWSERSLLARRLLREGDTSNAYALAVTRAEAPAEQAAEAAFLAGFIALRGLHDPAAAIRHFQALREGSKAVITQARAAYWLGRARAAAGEDPKPDYQAATAWPTTYYGQLAVLRLGDSSEALAARIRAIHDPSFVSGQVLTLAGHELARAALILVAWGEQRRAHSFLLQLDASLPDLSDRALAARLAARLGLPDVAVAVARRLGRDGTALPEAGWPMSVEPPAGQIDPALTLALIRQESSFDPGAVSPSGARGLMQLLPATAEAVSHQLAAGGSVASLTTDPAYNMRLGTAYLQAMLERFGGSLPLALAAYNAGPNRVEQWLTENGDPRRGDLDMVDWIELIPLGEPRNYVERVLENLTVYRVRRGEDGSLVQPWMH